MAYTQSDIDKLQGAMAKGVRSVRYASGQVDYQSREDMVAQLREMQAAVNPSTRATRRVAKVVSGF